MGARGRRLARDRPLRRRLAGHRQPPAGVGPRQPPRARRRLRARPRHRRLAQDPRALVVLPAHRAVRRGRRVPAAADRPRRRAGRHAALPRRRHGRHVRPRPRAGRRHRGRGRRLDLRLGAVRRLQRAALSARPAAGGAGGRRPSRADPHRGLHARRLVAGGGGVFAVGMLTKPPFAAYLLPPVVWLVVEERSRLALGNAAFAALVAAAVSLPWYGPRLVGMPRQIAFRAVTHAAEEGKPPTLSAVALAFYPTSLPVQLGVLATVLLVAGIVVALMRRQGLVVVAFLAPLALFMLLRNKDLRYTLPLVPAAAALAGLAVAALGPRLRGVALAVLAVVGGLQISAVAWAVPPPVTLPGLGTPWVLASPPAGGDWRQRDFLRIIVQDRAGRPATVSVVPNDNYFSVSNFRYYAVRDELPLRFTRPWEGEPLGIDYMILKTGDQGPDFSEAKSRRVIERLARDPALARAYPVIAEFPLPDGSTGMLRARRITDPAAAPPEALAQRLEAAMRRRVGEVARDVDGLEIRLSYDAEIARGRIQRLEVTARAATAGELRKRDAATLRLQHLRFVAADVLINPYALEAGRAELLDVGRFRLEQMEITAADLQAFVAGLKGFRGTRVQLVPGAIDLVVEQPGPDLAARVRLVPAADRPFAIAVDRARLGWVPLPRLLVDWVVRNYDPTPQIADRLPFRVEVARGSVSEQAIRVGE